MSADTSLSRRPKGPRACYTPTAEEIFAECARIQEKWSPEERAMRMSNSRFVRSTPQEHRAVEVGKERNDERC